MSGHLPPFLLDILVAGDTILTKMVDMKMKLFTEMYIVLYRINHRWKIKMYRGLNANDVEEKFRSSKIFRHMIKEDGDRYMIFVFTGVEDYV